MRKTMMQRRLYPTGKRIKFFRADPNKKGRGAGHYYHRGKGIFSKYTG